MREPRIHIRISDLKKALISTGLLPSISIGNAGRMESLIKACKPFTIKDNFILQAKSASIKKAKKSITADTHFVELFNKTLNSERLSANHQFIQQIRKGDSSFNLLQEITKEATEFAELYKLPFDAAFKLYIQIGLRLMSKKYGLNKFKYYKAKIFEAGEAYMILGNTPKALEDLATSIVRYYVQKCLSHGVSINADNLPPERMVNFILAAQECNEVKATSKNWIEAQFAQLAWMNAIPELTQLFGDNAKLRYEQWKAKQGFKLVERKEVIEYSSEDERLYYERLRVNKAE